MQDISKSQFDFDENQHCPKIFIFPAPIFVKFGRSKVESLAIIYACNCTVILLFYCRSDMMVLCHLYITAVLSCYTEGDDTIEEFNVDLKAEYKA